MQKNYTRTPGVTSGTAVVFDRKTRTSFGGFSFRKDCLYCGCFITVREKKTKKSFNVPCKNQEDDKAIHQAIFDRKDDEWSIEVKDPLLLSMTFVLLKTQCTINSEVQIFGLVKITQRKALCKKGGIHTTPRKETVFLKIVEHI